jgi:hypothetical protein
MLEFSTHFPSRNLSNAGCDTFQLAEAVPWQKHDEPNCHLSVMIQCYHKHIPYSINLVWFRFSFQNISGFIPNALFFGATVCNGWFHSFFADLRLPRNTEDMAAEYTDCKWIHNSSMNHFTASWILILASFSKVMAPCVYSLGSWS